MVKENKVICIAHRGASGSAPENTGAAFLEALNQKTDVIEFDIHTTKDNKFVVIHDGSIDRTSDGKGHIVNRTYAELKKFNFSPNKRREIILTLEQALKLITQHSNSTIIIVEFKISLFKHEKEALDIIHKYNGNNQIMIHSSHRHILKNIRKYDSKIKIGLIIFFSLFHHLRLPYYTHFIKKYNLYFFAISEIFPNKPFISKFISEIKKTGTKVYVWVVNDYISMNKTIAWKVDGVITNYPGIFKQVLSENK
ncbi:MAG: glycerophosphodiester phosphodiesterase family protein [Nanoarchaeota archaeon]